MHPLKDVAVGSWLHDLSLLAVLLSGLLPSSAAVTFANSTSFPRAGPITVAVATPLPDNVSQAQGQSSGGGLTTRNLAYRPPVNQSGPDQSGPDWVETQTDFACRSATNIFSTYWAALVVGHFFLLVVVRERLTRNGISESIPILSAYELQLSLTFLCMGLAAGIQCLRGRVDDDEGSHHVCGEIDAWILCGEVPMADTKLPLAPAPLGLIHFASYVETVCLVHVLVLVFVLLPKARLLYIDLKHANENVKGLFEPSVPGRSALRTPMIHLFVVAAAYVWVPILDTILRSAWSQTGAGAFQVGFLVIVVPILHSFLGSVRLMLDQVFPNLGPRNSSTIACICFISLGKLMIAAFVQDAPARYFSSLYTLTLSFYMASQFAFAHPLELDPLMHMVKSEWEFGEQQVIEHQMTSGSRTSVRGRHRQAYLHAFLNPLVTFHLLKLELPALRSVAWFEHLTGVETRTSYGQRAWQLWARFGMEIPGPARWPGTVEQKNEKEQLEDGDFVRNGRKIVLPSQLLPEERHIRDQLTRMSRWRWVQGDLFSDRIRSQEIPALLLTFVLTDFRAWDFLSKTNTEEILKDIPTPIVVLFESLLASALLWAALAILLIGNNAFSSTRVRLVWSVLMFLLAIGLSAERLSPIWSEKTADGSAVNLIGRDMDILWRLLICFILADLVVSTLTFMVKRGRSRYRDTYHTIELAALRYTELLIQGEESYARHMVNQLEEGQVFDVLLNGARQPCILESIRGDGTCTVFVEGNWAVQNSAEKIPSSEVTPAPLNRVLRREEGVLSKHLTRFKLDRIANCEKSWLGFIDDRLRDWDCSRDRASTSSSTFLAGTLSTATTTASKGSFKGADRQVMASMKLKEGIEEVIFKAGQSGEQREKDLQKQKAQTNAFRSFYIKSIGLPTIMLVAVMVSYLLLAFGAIWGARCTTSVGGHLRKVRSFAKLTSNLNTSGIEWACTNHGDVLSAFDHDLSQKLDVDETADMTRSITAILAANYFTGKAPTLLLPGELDQLLVDIPRTKYDDPQQRFNDESKSSGFTDLSDKDVEALLCRAADVLKSRGYQALEVKAVALGETPINGEFLIAVLDQPPRDNALTKAEVRVSILPALDSLVPGYRDTFSHMIDVLFTQADTHPSDGKITAAEADVLGRDILTLVQAMPELLSTLAGILSNELDPSHFNSTLILRVLDFDKNGTISRMEAKKFGIVLAEVASRPSISEYILQAFDLADVNPTDGKLDAAELDDFALRVQQVLLVLRQLSKLMAAGQDPQQVAQTVLDPALLVLVLDRDGNGLISENEFSALAQLAPPPTAQASLLLSLIFQQADTNPNDEQLSETEMAAAVDKIRAILPQVPPETEVGQAGTGKGRRLEEDTGNNDALRDERVRRGVESVLPLTAVVGELIFQRYTNTTQVVLNGVVGIFMSDEYAIIAPLVVLGLRLSLILAVAYTTWMINKTRKEHETLSMQMQRGNRTYLGHTHRDTLRNSFAYTTMFPGQFVVQVMANFVMCTLVFFLVIAIVATPIVLLILPGTRHLIVTALKALLFPLIAAILRLLIKYVVLDKLLVEHGNAVHPEFFSILWIAMVLLNFVQAPLLGLFRYIYLILVALIQCTYIHTSTLGEHLVNNDPGYFSFLALTFTQSSRRNLVRRAFISLIMPQVHRMRTPEPPADQTELEGTPTAMTAAAPAEAPAGTSMAPPQPIDPALKRRRIRNKLWLSVTLFNNPELKKERRRPLAQELERIQSLRQCVENPQEENPRLGRQGAMVVSTPSPLTPSALTPSALTPSALGPSPSEGSLPEDSSSARGKTTVFV